MTSPTAPIPAATVVLLRDGPHGPEALMLRKNAGQAFGGLWVFPGGRVEDDDGEPVHAAVREAAEETGLVLSADELVPFAHWLPPPEAPKRYATWFFVAALPPDAADVVVDGGEIGDHVWTSPADALDRHRRGEIDVAPPTWVTLYTFVEMASAADAVAWARAGDVDFHETRVRSHRGEMVTLWTPDVGYDGGDLDSPGPRNRLWMAADGWRYERS